METLSLPALLARHGLMLLLAAVLVFWAVGAYNRLVRLRQAVVRAFEPVGEQLQLRHQLLLKWADSLQTLLEQSPQPLDTLRTVCEAVRVSAVQAAGRPASARLVAQLRQAEDALQAARAQVLAELPARAHQLSLNDMHLDAALLSEPLAAADTTLAFARQRFNQAVQDHNDALLQFPTVLIGGLFGFRGAATL